MLCPNCSRQIPDSAKVCLFCEADVSEGLMPEEIDAAQEALAQIPPDAFAELLRLAEDSATADDFVNSIMVGECPKCGSADTGDCENDPEIDDLLVGRCYACGQLFCTECLRLLSAQSPSCDCFEDDEDDDEDFEDDDID